MTATLTVPAPEAPERQYLSPQDLSRIYGATPVHWRKLILRGDIQGFRLGDVLVRVRRADVEAYILGRPIVGPAAARNGCRHGKKTGPRPGSRRAR
jgi:hypothetical protein